MPPKRKQAKNSKAHVEADSSDSAGEDTAPSVPPKKAPKKPQSDADDSSDPGVAEDQKTVAASGSNSAHRAAKDIDGCATWKLAQNRFVTVSEFKGRTYVNIREYYEKDGKQLPGKKGISMPLEQWKVLAECMADVNAVLATKK